jgi:hypothetical protein
MIACGLDWKKVSEFLGHTDVRTTFNRYGKVVEEDLSDAADRLDAYFELHRETAAGRSHAGPGTGRSPTRGFPERPVRTSQ